MLVEKRIQVELNYLYGKENSEKIWREIENIIIQFINEREGKGLEQEDKPSTIDQEDIILITYADHIKKDDEAPLQALERFLNKYLTETISTVHILPFFPYSSDDGFSIIDYYRVNPEYGDWRDIKEIGKTFRLMFDAVINHISRESKWFQAFLKSQKPFLDFFITIDAEVDLSTVVRPRALPLLTPVVTDTGEKYVWTTFSDDQIDLDYSNPKVLLEIIKLLLFYVQKGASIIRLDAIAYLWKEVGTPCIHLPQTHSLIRIIRAVLDEAAPYVYLITETNVPHEENITYFGKYLQETNRTDEAQIVYQFPLAPLILHTFFSEDASILTRWIDSLEEFGLFFNFIASHDGIGVMPAEGLLSQSQIKDLVETTKAHNGFVSYRRNPDGSESVYELNIALYDALNDPNNPNREIDIKRFLASQAIMLSLSGIPGIYLNSLFGFRNCYDCFIKTKRPRSINREKLSFSRLEEQLADAESIAHLVFEGYCQLLRLRKKYEAFHPKGSQEILQLPPSVFGLLRCSPSGKQVVFSLINVTSQEVSFSLDLSRYNLRVNEYPFDLISGKSFKPENESLHIELSSYQTMWIFIEI